MRRGCLYIVYLLHLFIGAGLYSCRSKKQEIPPVIDLNLQVNDEHKRSVKKAIALLFNKQEAFNLAKENSLKGEYNALGTFATAEVRDGKVDFLGLPSNTNYWVLIYDKSERFYDATTLDSLDFYITRNNVEANFSIAGYQNGTDVQGIVNLLPVNSLVKFDNSSGVAFQHITLGRDDIVGFDLTKYKEVKRGDLSYTARTGKCIWMGSIAATGGAVVHEALGECSALEYSFQHVGTNLNVGEYIDIYMGQNKATGVPLLRLTNNSVKVIVLANPGTLSYTYYARHSNGKCVWQDTVNSSNLLEACE